MFLRIITMGQRTSNALHLIDVYLLLSSNVSYIFQDAEVLYGVGMAIESLDLARIRVCEAQSAAFWIGYNDLGLFLRLDPWLPSK